MKLVKTFKNKREKIEIDIVRLINFKIHNNIIYFVVDFNKKYCVKNTL